MAQNQMEMTGKNFGEEQPELRFKFNIGMEELRDIVQYLNRKPFEQNFTLLSFDELGPTESLELVNSIFAKIDKKNDVKLKDEGAEKTLDRFVEFLRILDYPGRFDDDTVKRFMLGDKKVLHPIIYYCLVNFEPLIKRAYINKFLLPITVPDEYTVDDEVKRSYTDYQSLIAEFKDNHKVYEEKSKSANLAALKEEIISMEKDKENLGSKIKEHQHKFENNADFQEILREITFQRKEQEDEATLIDKLRQQRRLLDRSKEELELALQKQFDAKRTIGEESSPDEMIFALKQEIARTKNKINEMTFELKERRKKIVENEKRLYEPLPSPDQIDAMKTKVSMLRNYVVDMNRKLESNRNQDKEDKLFIPKQQEMTVRKKKETVEADMKKLEQEKEAAEDRLREKQKELVGCS